MNFWEFQTLECREFFSLANNQYLWRLSDCSSEQGSTNWSNLKAKLCSREETTPLRYTYLGLSSGSPPTVPEENKLFQFCFRTIEEVKQVSGEDPTNFQWGAIGKQLFWNNLIWRYLSLCFFIFLCITMKNVESFQSCESHYNNLLSENWIKSTSSIQFKS